MFKGFSCISYQWVIHTQYHTCLCTYSDMLLHCGGPGLPPEDSLSTLRP